MIFNISKRDGRLVKFDIEKIATAFEKALSTHTIMLILPINEQES